MAQRAAVPLRDLRDLDHCGLSFKSGNWLWGQAGWTLRIMANIGTTGKGEIGYGRL